MSKSYPLQTYLKGQLEADFCQYRDEMKLSDAEVARQLLAFALQVKRGEKEEDRLSNRELIEAIYRSTRKTSAMNDIIFGQTFDGQKYYRDKSESTQFCDQIKADVNNKVTEYLRRTEK